jgi:D-amino-acid dehydrogenase
MQRDVVVLGAGIVGLATALKLQEKGRSVAIVDRQGAGEGTSFGNAGLIERASIYPYAFPRRVGDIVKYGLNNTPEAHYHPSYLPRIAPWLARYWWNGAPERHEAAMRALLPLIEASVSEHEPLIEAAGATPLVRRTGWLKLFRSGEKLDLAVREANGLRNFGVRFDVLQGDALRQREPNLAEGIAGGIHYLDPVCINDPGSLSRSYLHLFEQRGGGLLAGDAQTLAPSGSNWTVKTEAGPMTAGQVVVALGPWSDTVFRPLGYDIPLAVKRGYHMHYRPKGNAVLHHTLLDAENGYVLAPMARGIRLTTGAEFADRDAAPTPVQLERTEPAARQLFPLDHRVDDKPWMGARPCLPDMRPVIGEAPRHKGLWFNFGHAHHGLTLAASSGRLVSELMTGEAPFANPAPFSAARF